MDQFLFSKLATRVEIAFITRPLSESLDVNSGGGQTLILATTGVRALTHCERRAVLVILQAGSSPRQRAYHDTESTLRGHAVATFRKQLLLDAAAAHPAVPLPLPRQLGALERLGRATLESWDKMAELLTFIGRTAITSVGVVTRPQRLRWRSVLHHVQIGGFDALPIVGLMSFLLGVVVAYQGADQLRHYGANIFVVDLVGYAMLREFAPLMTAIVIAGRSGSSYAAQIGTMQVTEEIDAMRTIGIDPTEQLVLPRLLALIVALPLLTVFADITGVFGGMVMARTQLDIGFAEFLQRFSHEMQGSTLMVGLGKSVVFAVVIAVVGCFQGFRTRGSADSVGRQTTVSVVQATFIVIVVDAVFSVAFNILGI